MGYVSFLEGSKSVFDCAFLQLFFPGQLTEVKTSRKNQTESRKSPTYFWGHVISTVPKCMGFVTNIGPNMGPYKVGWKRRCTKILKVILTWHPSPAIPGGNFWINQINQFILAMIIWLVVSCFFYFHPYLWKIPILTNIFQGGWNHELVIDDPRENQPTPTFTQVWKPQAHLSY